jgi:HYR domain
MHPASNYQTEHRRPDKLKTSARRRATRSLRVARAATLLAFLFTLVAVFQTSGSHAGPAGERAKPRTATTSSGATAPSARTGIQREFGQRFLTAAPFQTSGSESIQTFDSGCTTPKEAFNLGDTVCVKATVPFSFLVGFRTIHIVDPANNVRASDIVTSLTHQFSFTLPTTEQSTIGGQTIDNRGSWRADLTTLTGSRRASSFFDVSATTAAADLQIVASPEDDIVGSGGSLVVIVYVLNAGPDAAENVVVTPPSDPGLTLESFVDTDLTAPNNECESPCTIESLAPRVAKKFLATYTVTASTGTKIVARASVTSDTEDPRPTVDYLVDEQNPAPPANTNVASIFVSVGAPEGNQACTLTCPANVVATANTTVNNEFGAFVTYGAASQEGECGEITNNPVSGSFFAVGTHTVTSSASGGGSCTFTVKVLDTPAPTISCPANKFATDTDNSGDESVAVGSPTFTASGGGTVTGLRSDSTPAVVDSEGNVITPAMPKPLTDPYLVGVTSILWTVTDADGRTASCTQTVTVSVVCNGGTDTTPPTINAPADITVETGANNTGCTVTLDDELGQPEVLDNCSVTYTVSGIPAGNNFSPGTYTLTYTATDASGNTASDTQTVIVRETSPPIIFAPADASYTCPENVPAASPSQAGGPLLDSSGVPIRDANGDFVPGGQPYDNCGTPTVTVTETSTGAGTPASPRVITRTYRATDASGNFSEAVQTITVTDGTAPTITAPAAVTAFTGPGATSCDTVVSNATLGTASAQDNCAGVTVTRSPAGNTFPVGTTTVVWTATDWAGNTATAQQTVTVVDNTAPVLTPPANVTAYTGPGATSCGTVVSDATIGTATATDNCPGVGTVTRTGVPAGNVFPEGTTTITYSVTDAHGNTTTAQQTVTVIDNTAPVISCPTDIVLEPSCSSGAIATWTAPVGTDNCPGATTTQTAGLASGSVFPIGTTTVTYTVNDAHGNSASCSFTVRVKTPAEVVQDLKVRVQALQPPLTGVQVQGLTSKLDAALSAINSGQTNVACNKLADFISQVQAYINNGTLTSAQGQPLITSAAKVRNTLGCTNNPCT